MKKLEYSRRYYQANKAKILARQKQRRRENDLTYEQWQKMSEQERTKL